MLARIRKAQENGEGGFTLIELLVVIIIIGILAAIAIPTFLNQRKKGYDAQAKSDLRNVATLQETYMTDNNVYATDIATLTDFKPSPNATTTVDKVYDSAGVATTTATAAVGGFCAKSVSASGKSFFYDSTKGGLQPTTATAC